MVTKSGSTDTGPLDWRIAITDKGGRPTPEFQRRWNTQRNNNDLIGTLTGNGAPTDQPTSDGQTYVDISVDPGVLYVSSGGQWLQVGPDEFIQLNDTPASYTGATNKVLRVNSAGTGVEFVTVSETLDELGAAQGDILYRNATGWTVLVPGTAGFVLSTAGPGADPEWIAAGGGGAEAFTDLTDVPSSYSGAAGELVRVNGAEDGLEFDTVTDVLDSVGSTEGDLLVRGSSDWTTIPVGTDGQVLTVDGGDPAWVDPEPSAPTSQGFGWSVDGLPAAGDQIGWGCYGYDITFANSDPLTHAEAVVPAHASAVCNITATVLGVESVVGTVTYGAGSSTGVVHWSTSPYTLPADAFIRMYAPSVVDTTLAYITGFIAGTGTGIGDSGGTPGLGVGATGPAGPTGPTGPPGPAPSFTQGSVVFQGASALAENNTNFFWDDTADVLKLGGGLKLVNHATPATPSSSSILYNDTSGFVHLLDSTGLDTPIGPGAASKTFTPVLSCATPGDLSVSYARQTGRYQQIGGAVLFNIILRFTPTYTTASGLVSITFPFASPIGNNNANAAFFRAYTPGLIFPTGYTEAWFQQSAASTAIFGKIVSPTTGGSINMDMSIFSSGVSHDIVITEFVFAS